MKSYPNFLLLLFTLSILSCNSNKNIKTKKKSQETISCSPILKIIKNTQDSKKLFFKAVYEGPEFVIKKGKYHDIAHQTSNRLTDTISYFLKSNFKQGNFYRLEIQKINVCIEGNVKHVWKSSNLCRYTLIIPLKSCSKKAAVTSLEHKGTWVRNFKMINEKEANLWKKRIEKRLAIGKVEIKKIETKSGFREYWVQFRNRNI